jgi:hypothetical protein
VSKRFAVGKVVSLPCSNQPKLRLSGNFRGSQLPDFPGK